MTITTRTQSPEIRITFDSVPRATAEQAARILMEALASDQAILDPVVSAQPAQGQVTMSFELPPTEGDLPAQIMAALAALRQAGERAARDGLPPESLANPSRFELMQPR